MDDDLRSLRRRLEADPGDADARAELAGELRRAGEAPFVAACCEAGLELAPSALDALAAGRVLVLVGGLAEDRARLAHAFHAQGRLPTDRFTVLLAAELGSWGMSRELFGEEDRMDVSLTERERWHVPGLLEREGTVFVERADLALDALDELLPALQAGVVPGVGDERLPLRSRVVIGLPDRFLQGGPYYNQLDDALQALPNLDVGL